MHRLCKICMAVFVAMVLCGCSLGTRGERGKESNPSLSVIGETTPGEWKDNSLDMYSARFIANVTPTELEEEFTYGGWNEVMSESRTYVLQKHLCLDDYSRSWDEIIVADNDGGVRRARLALPYTPENNNQVIRMGRVWGNDHLLCVNVEEGEDGAQWRVFELDENLEPQWDFIADFLEDGTNLFPECAMRDRDGNVHLAFRSAMGEGLLTHYVVSPEGTVLDAFLLEELEDGVKFTYGWAFSADGMALIKQATAEGANAEERVFQAIPGAGLSRLVFARQLDPSKPDYVKYEVPEGGVTGQDWGDGEVLFADETGIFFCDGNFENAKCQYLWSNHGITILEIEEVRRYGNGNLGIFFLEDGGDRFIILEPTTEQVEQVKITVAVPDYREFYYRPIVNEFNRKYPAWQVEIKTDYDETRLLAELGSGHGPVLVDTRITGFEKQVKLWEPLDGLLEAANMNDILLEPIMEGCRIDGITYGIALDCQLETVITRAGMTSKEWDYEKILSLAEDPAVKAIYPPYSADNSYLLIYKLMMHGLEDNYLINAGDLSNCIDGERLNRVLDLAEGKCQGLEENYDWEKAFQRGEVLCNWNVMRSCTFVTNLKNKYGSDVSFVGLPTSEGGKNLATAIIPISVRITASDEEKEVAHAFLLEAVSYEGQVAEIEQNYNFGISVRKDVFEYQIKTDIDNYLDLAKHEGLELSRKSLEEDAEIWRSLVSGMEAKGDLSQELKKILEQEFDEYWLGNATKEQLLDHLQNRVRLYLSE